MTSNYSDTDFYCGDLYNLSAIEDSVADLARQARYLDTDERLQLINCCFFAARAHEGQRRHSGEPYICHPIKVAEILAKEEIFELAVLQAAVLHDVIEDTDTDKDTVSRMFSEEVANLVDGVSKLEKDKSVSPKELQARTFEKLVFAMVADPRVVMIKFADRMHNMQTLDALRPEKRQRIAHETLEVYVPIAARLGMSHFKTELEELAFKHLLPWRYQVIKRLVKDNKSREDAMTKVSGELTQRFSQAGMTISLRKRRRNLYHVYRKLARNRRNRRPLENASIPFILIAETTEDCYRALYHIHDCYAPIANKLVDYISSPRVNGYRSLHTAVLTEDRRVINFQIRTQEMHNVAESGIIAILREEKSNLQQDQSIQRWLRNLMSMTRFTDSPIEYYEAVKSDLIGFDIQVFTPKGEPIALPNGATVIDFAYHIHSDIGNYLARVKVNDIAVTADYQLSDGQTIELSTSTTPAPNPGWLKHAKTARARSAIRHFLRTLPPEDLQQSGLTELENHLHKHALSYRYLMKMLEDIATTQYQVSTGELLQKIALRDVKCRQIRKTLQKMSQQNGVTSTLAVEVINQPGVLATIAETIANYQANILRIHFPDNMQAEMVVMKFEIHVELLSQLDSIVTSLKAVRFVKHVNYEEVTNETSNLD